jgi:hypothetical protein
MNILINSKPICFGNEMVQAIWEYRKNITRRLNGLQYINGAPEYWDFVGKTPEHKEIFYPANKGKIGDPWWQFTTNSGNCETFIVQCPYGKVGDVLWVREAWTWEGDTKYTDIAPLGNFYYKIDFDEHEGPSRWKSSRFMPKLAARIFLKITDIRVERLQEITNDDAIKEGTKDHMSVDEFSQLKGLDWLIPSPFSQHQFSFLCLWCRINGQQSWLDNPWVWVISFERCEKPEGFGL